MTGSARNRLWHLLTSVGLLDTATSLIHTFEPCINFSRLFEVAHVHVFGL